VSKHSVLKKRKQKLKQKFVQIYNSNAVQGGYFSYSNNMETPESPESINFSFLFPKTIFCVDPLRV
jgi:hypothetical protein